MEMEEEAIIDKYLSKPYWIIDVLPMQVPANGEGQYFRIEEYVRHSSLMETISRKFLALLLKINCYEAMDLFHAVDGWEHNPAPERLEQCLMALISISGDDSYMTLYTSDEKVVELLRPLAASVGLFVWQPKA